MVLHFSLVIFFLFSIFLCFGFVFQFVIEMQWGVLDKLMQKNIDWINLEWIEPVDTCNFLHIANFCTLVKVHIFFHFWSFKFDVWKLV